MLDKPEQTVSNVRSPGPRLPPASLVGYGLALGLGMIAAAWVWQVLLGDQTLADWFPRANWAGDLALGGLGGLVFALAAWRLVRRVPALRRIERLLVSTLDMPALRYHHAILIGLVAGVPEEILFRGAVQPALGLALTAVVFGALHALTPAYFVYATVAGLLLGGLAEWREGLLAPIAAHVAVDAVMVALLIRDWRRRQEAAPPPPDGN